VLAALVVASGRAVAQDEREPEAAAPPPAKPEGQYSGVTPGESTVKPHKASAKAPMATWVGFQPLASGRSRLFVQLTADGKIDQSVVGDTLFVTVADARVASANALRRLDTRFFDTPVREVTAKRVTRKPATKDQPGHPAGVQLAIAFKSPSEAAAAAARVAREDDGYHYVYLEFEPAPAVTAERAK
jgi:hypothetical protein